MRVKSIFLIFLMGMSSSSTWAAHAYAQFGDIKYPAGFTHFSYVNPAAPKGGAFRFVPVEYDHARLAREMREEKLPEEFVETVLTGWWTTCLEVLPAKERLRGRY